MVERDECERAGCLGPPVAEGVCLGHAGPHQRDQVLDELRAGIRLDALRGVAVTRELFDRVLAAVPRDNRARPQLVRPDFTGTLFEFTPRFDGAVIEGEASFDAARFPFGARFGQAVFNGAACFTGTRFDGPARFGEADFEGAATFDEARFVAGARFTAARFRGPATFARARFGRNASFERASFAATSAFTRALFGGAARFDGAAFAGAARFPEVTFDTWAGFDRATFGDSATFDSASFSAGAGLAGTRFLGNARWTATAWRAPAQLGPALVAGAMALDDALFHDHVVLRVAARELSCIRTRFDGGVRMDLRRADVVLVESELGAAALVGGAGRPFAELDEAELARVLDPAYPGSPHPGVASPGAAYAEEDRPGADGLDWRPRVTQLDGTDVSHLTVADADLRDCHFRGTRNLDRLRIEGDASFAPAPPGWPRVARRTVAEERVWRAARRTGVGGHPDPAPELADAPAPEEVSRCYQALRKGARDVGNEPAAADFHYGEMEMRRHARRQDARRQRASWRLGSWIATVTGSAVLWAYWALSGYGQRARRGLVAYAALVLLASAGLARWGFPDSDVHDGTGGGAGEGAGVRLDEFGPAVRFALRASTALLGGTGRTLTPAGEWIELGLRLAGPVLLGLTVLALRGGAGRGPRQR